MGCDFQSGKLDHWYSPIAPRSQSSKIFPRPPGKAVQCGRCCDCRSVAVFCMLHCGILHNCTTYITILAPIIHICPLPLLLISSSHL